MNNMTLWSDCKTQLAVKTLKLMLITRVNVDKPCVDFYELIIQNKKLLKSIHSVQKYKWRQKSEKQCSVATATATVSTVDAVNVENN